MTEPRQYNFYVECQFGGSHSEVKTIEPDEMRGMNEEQIDEYVSGLYENWLVEQCHGGYEMIEEEA